MSHKWFAFLTDWHMTNDKLKTRHFLLMQHYDGCWNVTMLLVTMKHNVLSITMPYIYSTSQWIPIRPCNIFHSYEKAFKCVRLNVQIMLFLTIWNVKVVNPDSLILSFGNEYIVIKFHIWIWVLVIALIVQRKMLFQDQSNNDYHYDGCWNVTMLLATMKHNVLAITMPNIYPACHFEYH